MRINLSKDQVPKISPSKLTLPGQQMQRNEEFDFCLAVLRRSLTPQGLIIPVVPHYQTVPWIAMAGRQIFTELETVFSDHYFMASSELNLLNTILLEDEAENK
ncbi:hypothetical protein [Nostoc sp.]|uniref:hypothetical protein n=1 Tax=Nostoc sp. TaxID=1180 RepID=UPI002FF6D4B5